MISQEQQAQERAFLSKFANEYDSNPQLVKTMEARRPTPGGGYFSFEYYTPYDLAEYQRLAKQFADQGIGADPPHKDMVDEGIRLFGSFDKFAEAVTDYNRAVFGKRALNDYNSTINALQNDPTLLANRGAQLSGSIFKAFDAPWFTESERQSAQGIVNSYYDLQDDIDDQTVEKIYALRDQGKNTEADELEDNTNALKRVSNRGTVSINDRQSVGYAVRRELDKQTSDTLSNLNKAARDLFAAQLAEADRVATTDAQRKQLRDQANDNYDQNKALIQEKYLENRAYGQKVYDDYKAGVYDQQLSKALAGGRYPVNAAITTAIPNFSIPYSQANFEPITTRFQQYMPQPTPSPVSIYNPASPLAQQPVAQQPVAQQPIATAPPTSSAPPLAPVITTPDVSEGGLGALGSAIGSGISGTPMYPAPTTPTTPVAGPSTPSISNNLPLTQLPRTNTERVLASIQNTLSALPTRPLPTAPSVPLPEGQLPAPDTSAPPLLPFAPIEMPAITPPPIFMPPSVGAPQPNVPSYPGGQPPISLPVAPSPTPFVYQPASIFEVFNPGRLSTNQGSPSNTSGQPQGTFIGNAMQANTAPITMRQGGAIPSSARSLASYGRNGDSMLVHMTPGEVRGLQALAMAHGGSLSVNPYTGLVEANFLKRILPALAGAALTIGSGGAINPWTAGMIVGGVETARTGDIGKGFMAGLGAYGGAGLGAGFSAAGATAAPTTVTPAVDPTVAAAQTGTEATIASQPAASFAGGNLAGTTTTTAATAPTSSVGANFAQAGQGVENIFSSGQTGELARTNFIGAPAQAATPTTAATPATGVGGYSGLAKSTLAAASPAMIEEPAPPPTPEDPYANYKGPVKPSERAISYPDDDRRRRGVTSEFTYFTPSNPIPYAEGGPVGGFMRSPIDPSKQTEETANGIGGLLANFFSFTNRQPVLAPETANATPATRVQDNRGLVYNPIPTNRTELVYNPAAYNNRAIPSRETNHRFKPVQLAGIPDALKDVHAANKTFGSKNIFGAEIPNIKANYTYDARTQTLRPTQAYLDALEARRQQQLSDAATAAAAEEQARLNYGYSVGGSVPTLEEGGFVLTKKAVDGLGKGNNKKGQKVAQAGLGAIPIKGKGTGTSDSIRTTIAGRQPALVSNGEAYVPARKVKENGGAKAFYALMRRAEKAA